MPSNRTDPTRATRGRGKYTAAVGAAIAGALKGNRRRRHPAEVTITQEELDRMDLAMHLASDHADPMAPQRGLAQNRDQHAHEHAGPGTIRNHSADSMHFDLEKAQANILEMLRENGKL